MTGENPPPRSYPINRATEILEEDLESNRLGVRTLENALELWNPCESGDVRGLLDSEQPDQLHDAHIAIESVEEDIFVRDGVDTNGLGR